jgi:hypothetical protein
MSPAASRRQMAALARTVNDASKPGRLACAGLLATKSSMLLGDLGLNSGVLAQMARLSRSVADPLGLSAALPTSPAFGLRAADTAASVAYRDAVRDITAFSSHRSFKTLPATVERAVAMPKFVMPPAALSNLVARQPALGTNKGVLAGLPRASAYVGADWWRLERSLDLMATGAGRQLALIASGRYGGEIAAVTRMAAALRPIELMGDWERIAGFGVLRGVSVANGQRLTELAAGLQAGRLMRPIVMPWAGVSGALRLGEMMTAAALASPAAVLERLVAEASALEGAWAGADVALDEPAVEDSLLASAISAGQDLLEVSANATSSPARWVWQVPLWWAPALVRAWPTLTTDQRDQVRYQAAAASACLMIMASYALSGNWSEFLIAAVAAYAAVGLFYNLIQEIDPRD